MHTTAIVCVIAAMLAMVFSQELFDMNVINQIGVESTRFFEERKLRDTNKLKLANGDVVGVYGVSFSLPRTTNDLSCMASTLGENSFAIPRGSVSGYVDQYISLNLDNARQAGFKRTDTYITPCPKCQSTGASQINNLVSLIRKGGFTVSMIWLDIEGVDNWFDGSQTADNISFVQSLLAGCGANGVRCGVYTTKSQWEYIMRDSTVGASFPLWYANYNKVPNFGDFVPFGGWTKPAMKQYKLSYPLCNIGMDFNIY